jgi:Tfp pilus assembly protein PilV
MFATKRHDATLPSAKGEDGMMLLEVVISALLVGLIVIGTLTGIDASNKATGTTRATAQATVIAQHDEERLRGLTATELARLGSSTQSVAENGLCIEQASGSWRYASKEKIESSTACEKGALAEEFAGRSYSATVFTLTSSASFASASKETLTCETENASADYIQTTSSVTWPGRGSRPAVSQSSIVAVPKASTLMVRVKNRNSEALEGAQVSVYQPSTASSPTATETTPAAGCVIFGELEEGTVKVITTDGSYVNKEGGVGAEKSLKVSPGSLAEAEFTIEAPGTLVAKFENNHTSVSSYTFVAFNTAASQVGGNVNAVSSAPELTKLFPFVTPGKPWKENKYTVYAGDCSKNNPVEVAPAEVKEAPSIQLEPGANPAVGIEVPEVKLTVYGEGTSGTKDPLTSTSAKVINKECSGSSAPYEHEAKVTAGALEQKYLPYAKKLELCVVAKVGSSYYKNTLPFTNAKKAGTTETLYLQSTGYTKSSFALTC